MRYSRQEAFKHIGTSGQKNLSLKKVVIIGVGGLGTNACEMLARAGVGHIVLVDDDVVSLDNLQRQALYTEKDVGRKKAIAAAEEIMLINSSIKCDAHLVRLSEKNLSLLGSDLVLDCTDNFEARRLINKYCKGKIAWVFASVLGSSGMVMDFLPSRKICFECVFKDAKDLETNVTAGILNSAVKAVAAFQVTEALKILTGQKASEELVHIDVWKQAIEKIKVKQDKNCKI